MYFFKNMKQILYIIRYLCYKINKRYKNIVISWNYFNIIIKKIIVFFKKIMRPKGVEPPTLRSGVSRNTIMLQPLSFFDLAFKLQTIKNRKLIDKFYIFHYETQIQYILKEKIQNLI